jgi:Putative Ig domain
MGRIRLAVGGILAAVLFAAGAASASARVVYVGSFGSDQIGGEPWGGAAVDSDGNLFVADGTNNRIDEFSATGAFVKAFGWGVAGGTGLETCTTSCDAGTSGGGAGEFETPTGVTIDAAGDLFISDYGGERVDEFTTAGTFIKAFGWGVSDGEGQLETCTNTCQAGTAGFNAGELFLPVGIAVDASGEVFVDEGTEITEFTTAGSFVRAFGWGVSDGDGHFEDCTTTCQSATGGSGAGQLAVGGADPRGLTAAGSGDLFVADYGNNRIEEFTTSGGYVKAFGWGVLDGKSQYETCTTTCQAGLSGGGAGEMDEPTDVTPGYGGALYVSDLGNDRVDEFTTSGAFIQAFGWGVSDGQSQLETCTSACEAGLSGQGNGEVYAPESLVANATGQLLVVEYTSVDEFGVGTPPAITSAASASFDTTVTGTFTVQSTGSPTAALTESGALPSGLKFTDNSNGTATIKGAPASGTAGTYVITITAANGVSPAATQRFTLTVIGPPRNVKRPHITGTAKSGHTLTCAPGTWSPTADVIFYQWAVDGTPIAGATGDTYKVQAIDEGTTLTCAVIEASAAGAGNPATSAGVSIPVPHVKGCPPATGSLSGTTLGLVKLGMTEPQAHRAYSRSSTRGFQYKDFFCLTPRGVRVGYASPKLVKTLSKKLGRQLKGRVIWASTSSERYSIKGIRPGATVAAAAAKLHTEKPFHIGLNYWYLAAGPKSTYVLKVRGNVVEEIGIGVKALTGGRKAQRAFLTSFD